MGCQQRYQFYYNAVMFIVFEGIDGAGKSTQVDLFCQWLKKNGRPFTTCADPGSTSLGDAIRDILLRRKDLKICGEAEMLMFMTARAQMVKELIRPSLENGEIVVCDRYTLSTAAYQGIGGELELSDIWSVAGVATGGLTPDLTFVFDLPLEEVFRRLGDSRDRMESRSEQYFEKVVRGYRQLSGDDPNCHLLDATQTIEEIQSQIRKLFTDKVDCAGVAS